MSRELQDSDVERLATVAWEVRAHSRILGATAVGCAVLDEQGRVFGGCNVEHRFRSHDVHAEVNAIGTLVAGGGEALVAAFIAAERENFTPCGACLDWIFELGGGECVVLVQSALEVPPVRYFARDLMPHYPY